MSALLWLALAGLLLLIELLSPGFGGFLMGAVAALLLSALTGPLALAPGLQWGLFLILTLATNALLWRWSRRQRQRSLHESGQAELAEVLEGFETLPGRGSSLGRVRWQGQSWAAENLEPGGALPPGSQVTVMGRDGTRLQVVPRGR